MQFFADRLVSDKMFEDCKGIINPAYSVDQLSELYLGIYDGIDYTSYADARLSSEEMYVKRSELSCSTYAKVLVGENNSKDVKVFLNKISANKGNNS